MTAVLRAARPQGPLLPLAIDFGEFERIRDEILDRFALQHGCLNEAILTRAGELVAADLIVHAVKDAGHPTHRKRMSPEEEARWLIRECGFRL